MGDTTNMALVVKDTHGVLSDLDRDQIGQIMAAYDLGDLGSQHRTHKDMLIWEVSDVSLGEQEEVAGHLTELIEDGYDHPDEDDVVRRLPDVAYKVWTGPRYEHPGQLHWHIPGHPDDDFIGDCDAEGNPLASAESLQKAVNDALSLDGARAAVARLTGETMSKAWLAKPSDPVEYRVEVHRTEYALLTVSARSAKEASDEVMELDDSHLSFRSMDGWTTRVYAGDDTDGITELYRDES